MVEKVREQGGAGTLGVSWDVESSLA